MTLANKKKWRPARLVFVLSLEVPPEVAGRPGGAAWIDERYIRYGEDQ